jgi:hypothetical protein
VSLKEPLLVPPFEEAKAGVVVTLAVAKALGLLLAAASTSQARIV